MRHRLRAIPAIIVLAAASIAAAPSTDPALDQAVVSAMTERSRADGSSLISANAGTEVNVQRATPSGDWAFGSSVIKAPNVEGAYPEGWLFLAQRTATGWRVGLDGTGDFADLAQKAPDSVVSQGEKKTFAANSKAAQARTAQAAPTGLSLPYPVGASWRIIGGPHGWSGQPRPWSSIDLDSRAANRDVLAAQSGRAYSVCSNGGHIRIIHDNGWTTEYYHLLNEIRPAPGTPVRMGDYLGQTSTRIPCGGSAGSNHVHFALKSGSSWVPLQDKTIGGWTYFEGSSAYGGGAHRGGVYRYTGDWLQNHGPETGGRTFENTGNHDVPDLGQAESPITVSGMSGNAPASLGVYLDVHHGWRGDLQIDLVGPTGLVYRLRDPVPADDGTIIHENHTTDASQSPANGTWRLRVKDVDGNHSGYIDAWSLTF